MSTPPSPSSFRIVIDWSTKVSISLNLSKCAPNPSSSFVKDDLARVTDASGVTLKLAIAHEPSLDANEVLIAGQIAQLVGWKQGTIVGITTSDPRISSISSTSTATAHSAVASAHQLVAHVWKPTVCLRRMSSSASADSPLDPLRHDRFRSPILSELLHASLLSHKSIDIDAPHSYRVLRWHGMMCLAKIVSMTALDVQHPCSHTADSKTGDPPTASTTTASSTSQSTIEISVATATITTETEVICEVETQPPTIVQSSVDTTPHVASVANTSPLPHFSHLNPNAVDSDGMADIFPNEWANLHHFIHNAMRSHSISASSTSSPSSLSCSSSRSFGWSIPRTKLMIGSSGVGKTKLLDSFIASLNKQQITVRRMRGNELIHTESNDSLHNLLTALNNDLTPANSINSSQTHKCGLIILEDMDEIM